MENGNSGKPRRLEAALLGLAAALVFLCGCVADDVQAVNDCDNTGHDGQCWVFGIGNAKCAF